MTEALRASELSVCVGAPSMTRTRCPLPKLYSGERSGPSARLRAALPRFIHLMAWAECVRARCKEYEEYPYREFRIQYLQDVCTVGQQNVRSFIRMVIGPECIEYALQFQLFHQFTPVCGFEHDPMITENVLNP
jgi:hypothetical protein